MHFAMIRFNKDNREALAHGLDLDRIGWKMIPSGLDRDDLVRQPDFIDKLMIYKHSMIYVGIGFYLEIWTDHCVLVPIIEGKVKESKRVVIYHSVTLKVCREVINYMDGL